VTDVNHIATPATTLVEWAAANPDAPLCISVGAKKETAAFLWALASYSVPATVRVDATDPKVFHISVPASYLTAPVLWLATLREDAQTCTAPANGYKHVTQEVTK